MLYSANLVFKNSDEQTEYFLITLVRIFDTSVVDQGVSK